METEVLADPGAVARRGAELVAEQARHAVAARGRFCLAVSGGSTPWQMLAALAERTDVPWAALHLFQVDERVAPRGDPARNLTQLEQSLLAAAPLARQQVHAMPVETRDLAAAAAAYERTLCGLAGSPPALDLVHLGLGEDGHTASLVPGDPVLQREDADVAVTAPYRGHRRMTLTFPAIDRARRILWLLTGAGKAEMLRRLLAGDRSIPAGRVRRDTAWFLLDRAAAGGERYSGLR